jgi:hypothetical protein
VYTWRSVVNFCHGGDDSDSCFYSRVDHDRIRVTDYIDRGGNADDSGGF